MKKNKKSNAKRVIILLLFFVTTIIYLVWRAFFTIPIQYGLISVIAGSILFIAEFIGFFESSVFYFTLWKTDEIKYIPPDVEDKEFPDVDIFVATYNEPYELLYKTIIGCKNMEYPDKQKVHIHICDDGRREEMKELAENLNVNYIIRDNNEHAKAGNLNHALSITNAPYVVTFDADMIPMHDFLLVTIPYFLTGEKVGYVQVPQNFYNADLFQYNLFTEEDMPNEQDLFSRSIQAGKAKYNAVIYAGSNTVLSRAALDEIGGLVTGTITEDFATGMMIQRNGYLSKYVNEVHASGLAPETLEDLFNQRIRWGRGVIQTFKKFNPMFMKGLNFKQKILYLSTFSYWYFGLWRLIFFLAPILFGIFGIIVLDTKALTMICIWLPMFLFTNYTFRYFTNNVRSVSWSHIYDTILFPPLLVGVLKETFGIKMSKFKVTPKENVQRDQYTQNIGLIKFQMVLAILTLISIGRIIYLFIDSGYQVQFAINFFWLVYNFYIFAMTIFFTFERPKFRKAERIKASIKAEIENGGKKYSGNTFDISEHGISLILDKPLYFDSKKFYSVKLSSERYKSTLNGKIIRVDTFDDKYKYIFKTAEESQKDKDNYLMMLYDRVPEFQTEQSNKMSKNIVENIKRRRKKFYALNRKLPRIQINERVVILVGKKKKKLHVIDFNYEYMTSEEFIGEKEFTWKPLKNNKYILRLKYDEELTKRVNREIIFYKVLNYSEEMGPIVL